VLKLVDQGVGALELAGDRHLGMHHHAGQVVQLELARPAFDLDVTEAHEGEVRLEDLDARALERVLQELLGRPQVGDVEVALLIEHLGVLECDGRPGRPLHVQPHPADHVLPEVDDRLPGRRMDDLDWLEFLLSLDERRGLCDDHLLTVVQHAHARPIVRGIAGLGPARMVQPGVVNLAHVDVGHADGPLRCGPLIVARDDRGPAVLVGDVELEQQRQAVAPGVPVALEADEPAIPAVAQQCTDRVGAVAQQGSDVVSLVLDVALVGRPAGREHRIAHALPVNVQLVQAEAGHIDARVLDCAVELELAAEQGGGLRLARIFVPVGRDPLRLPLGRVEQAHLEERGLAPCRLERLAGGICGPHAHLPGVTLPGGERRAFIRHVD